MKKIIKEILRYLLAAFVISAGVGHFLWPEPFVRIVPDYLPNPLLLVYVSGFFEILGGIGLLIPKVARWAAWGLIALFIAVLPANVYMAMNNIPLGDTIVPNYVLWARLPAQLLLILWAWWYTRE